MRRTGTWIAALPDLMRLAAIFAVVSVFISLMRGINTHSPSEIALRLLYLSAWSLLGAVICVVVLQIFVRVIGVVRQQHRG